MTSVALAAAALHLTRQMHSALHIPTLDKIRAARPRLVDIARRTELLRFDPGNAAFPGSTSSAPTDLRLKLECSQPTGSFKIRGAANAMAVATPESLAGGVWTASAGNMAQGVARCARYRGIPCRVVVPEHAPRAKTDAIEVLGAEVVRVSFERWWNALVTHSHPGMDGFMVHPFADSNVMAGNGTIGLEIAEDFVGVDAVLIPWGGGGLTLGIAAALRDLSPHTKIYAVEVETAAPLTASLAAGSPVTVHRTQTFIDGMGSDRVSDEMWPLIPRLVTGTIVVTVAQVTAALKLLVERADLVAEGAGAATVAAALGGNLNGVPGERLDADRVACIISGGNINSEIVSAILRGELP